MNKLTISELDCIFISYDEPNAEGHWADLRSKCIWADRVHGVKGSDECHKAAARLSNTDWFVTVDADNMIDEKFFEQTVELSEGAKAFSWPGVNIINGLRYGNGSLKLWNKEFVLNMKTHEASITKEGQVDFCWEDGYRPMVDSYSVTYPNGSPYQAWRAGFREGVKMSLIDGIKVAETINELHWHNLHRLKIWGSIGSHVDNGLWAILGARQGAYMTMLTDWNWIEVRDFDALSELWKNVKTLNVADEIEKYGRMLNNELGVKLELIAPTASEFIVETFKDQFQQVKEQLRWTMWKNNAL
jgi:hypothetical protein